jgi:hypothetical protein
LNVKGEEKLVWTLNIWNPSPGSLRLFTFFSPPQVLLFYLSSMQNCGFLIVIAGIVAIMVSRSNFNTVALLFNRFLSIDFIKKEVEFLLNKVKNI